jgi:hypothetical protein
MSIDPSILVTGRTLGVLVFGLAIVGKARHLDEYVGVVANYRVLPERLSVPAAWLVLILEALVAVGLGTGVALVWSAACAVGLLWLFAMAMTVNLVRGRRHIDCGCFQSALRQPLGLAPVVRNLALIALLLPLLTAGGSSASMFQMINGLAAGFVLFVLYLALDQLRLLRESSEELAARYG